MTAALDRNAERASGLQERLASLIEAHTQAEIARRTEFSPNNVSRYSAGTRMPLEFGSALVETLGINPAWLLTGEGTPYLSDISSGTREMAGDLLALVGAMASVNRMRLGSLTGKHHLGVLRDLNEALAQYEGLRAKLNQHSRPILLKLIDEIRDALLKRDLNRAETLLAAATQVSRLADDLFLQAQLEGTLSHFHHAGGNAAEALSHQRRSFLSMLLNRGTLDEWTQPEAHNFVKILETNGRFEEARRVARASIELCGGQQVHLEAAGAALDVELGDLARALDTARRVLPRAEPRYRLNIEQTLARGQLLEGSMNVQQAVAFGGDSEAKWSRLIAFAALSENAESLALVLKQSESHVPREHFAVVHAKCLAEALAEGGATPAQRMLVHIENTKQPNDPLARFAQECFVAQLFRVGGQRKQALRHTAAAQELLQGLEQGVLPRLELRAMHARNVVALCDGDAKKQPMQVQASSLLAEYAARGYRALVFH